MSSSQQIYNKIQILPLAHTALRDLAPACLSDFTPYHSFSLTLLGQVRCLSVFEIFQAHSHLRAWKLFLYLEHSSPQLCILLGSSLTVRNGLPGHLLKEAFPEQPLSLSLSHPTQYLSLCKALTIPCVSYLFVYYLMPLLNRQPTRAGILSHSQLHPLCPE